MKKETTFIIYTKIIIKIHNLKYIKTHKHKENQYQFKIKLK